MRTRSMEIDSSGAPHGGVPHGVNSSSSGTLRWRGGGSRANEQSVRVRVCAGDGWRRQSVSLSGGDAAVLRRVAARGRSTTTSSSRRIRAVGSARRSTATPTCAIWRCDCAVRGGRRVCDAERRRARQSRSGEARHRAAARHGGQQWGALPIEVVDFVKRRFQRHFLEGVLRVASGLPRSAARDAHHGSSSPHDFLSRSPRAAVDFIATRIGGHRAMSQSAHSLSRDPSPVRDAHAEDDAAVDGGGGDKLRRSGYRKARKSSTAARPESDSRENLLAPPTPQPINAAAATEELIAFSRYVTKTSRKFMWNNPRLQLPNDFTSVPGKQDHGTCLICVVGDNGLPSV
jgi:hypothetical protein